MNPQGLEQHQTVTLKMGSFSLITHGLSEPQMRQFCLDIEVEMSLISQDVDVIEFLCKLNLVQEPNLKQNTV